MSHSSQATETRADAIARILFSSEGTVTGDGTMRILTLTNWYPPHHRGGYEMNCEDVMNRLASRGHQVTVLCSDDRLPWVDDGSPSVPVQRVLKLHWKNEAPSAAPLTRRLALERFNQGEFIRAIEEVRPDVVSVWHMATLSMNLLTVLSRRRIPVVYAICDPWPCYAVSMDPWARTFNGRPVRRLAGRLAERLTGLSAVLPDLGSVGRACFVSRFTQEQVGENSKWHFDDATVIPSGIDRTMLDLPIPTDGESESEWRWKIGYMGRFDPRKGTETLLRGFSLLPTEAKLFMYGRGGEAERRRLQGVAGELGVADRAFFGTLGRSELAQAYRDLDCVVFPSEWPEPFGLVPLEAMECGTPVAATGVGGSKDFLIDGVNSVLFEQSNPDALASAVLRLASDPGLRAALVNEGRRTAAQYDVELMADRYERELITAAETPALHPRRIQTT